MAVHFQKKDGGVTFPRTMQEWMGKINPATGTHFTEAQADHKMCQDVFGPNYKLDQKGYPIETGRGSAANPASESLKAIEREKSAAEQAKARLGWHRGLEHAFDPRSAS
jgi:hypothetical protein